MRLEITRLLGRFNYRLFSYWFLIISYRTIIFFLNLKTVRLMSRKGMKDYKDRYTVNVTIFIQVACLLPIGQSLAL